MNIVHVLVFTLIAVLVFYGFDFLDKLRKRWRKEMIEALSDNELLRDRDKLYYYLGYNYKYIWMIRELKEYIQDSDWLEELDTEIIKRGLR